MGAWAFGRNAILQRLKKLGCVAYYDSVYYKDSYTAAAAVGSWKNIIDRTAKELAQAGGTRPVNTSSGPVALDFDGTDDTVSAVAFTAIAQPTTHIIVFACDSLPGATEQYLIETNATVNRQTTWINSTDQLLKIYAGTTLSSGQAVADNNWHVFTAGYNGASSTTRYDGAAKLGGNAGTNTIDSLRLATYYTGGSALQHFNGKIGAFMLFNKVLVAADALWCERLAAARFPVTFA